MHEVDHQKHHIPNHHVQVAPVQSRPRNEETTSCQGERHNTVDSGEDMIREDSLSITAHLLQGQEEEQQQKTEEQTPPTSPTKKTKPKKKELGCHVLLQLQ